MSNGDVFARIARTYDRVNRVLSLGQDQAWRRRVVTRLPQGRILDLGGGTGAANPVLGGREIVAVDPAPQMLGLNPAGRRVVGVGEHLPFEDGSFDAVVSAFVFRNLDSVDETLAEIDRVLRPGGKAGIVDLGRPAGSVTRLAHRIGTAGVLNVVGTLVGARGEYAYLHRSLDKLPAPEVLFEDGAMRLDEVWRMGPLGFVYGAVLVKA